jgi:hypothetical protein
MCIQVSRNRTALIDSFCEAIPSGIHAFGARVFQNVAVSHCVYGYLHNLLIHVVASVFLLKQKGRCVYAVI